MSAPGGGVCSGRCLLPGVGWGCLLRGEGVCSRGEVSAPGGGVCSRGVSAPGCVCSGVSALGGFAPGGVWYLCMH